MYSICMIGKKIALALANNDQGYWKFMRLFFTVANTVTHYHNCAGLITGS